MRGLAALALATVACGRVAFDDIGDNDGTDNVFAYRDVRSVYIVARPMESLVPDAVGLTSFSITPALPAGVVLDPATGTIDGTPTVATPRTSYTVSARGSTGARTASLALRTADGFIINDSSDAGDADAGDGLCETATGNDRCTLRAFVQEVNGGAGGSRSLAYAPAQTIVLESALPALTEPIELVGETTASTILDGGTPAQIFTLGTDDVRLTLTDLTYRNASTIDHNFRNNIAVMTTRVRVTNCNGFVTTSSSGEISLVDSTFDANTSTIVRIGSADIVIDRCTFMNNSAPMDAVLYFIYGNIQITSSTFTGNVAPYGALLVNNGVATFAHNTIVGNTATTTFAAGGVSQFSTGTSTLVNNLVAHNNGDRGNCSLNGMITSNGGNLFYPMPSGGEDCAIGPLDLAYVDPLVQPLADNGGPTLTMTLAAGSPALDAAIAAGCPALDQRGIARPQGGGCDIGAVEPE